MWWLIADTCPKFSHVKPTGSRHHAPSGRAERASLGLASTCRAPIPASALQRCRCCRAGRMPPECQRVDVHRSDVAYGAVIFGGNTPRFWTRFLDAFRPQLFRTSGNGPFWTVTDGRGQRLSDLSTWSIPPRRTRRGGPMSGRYTWDIPHSPRTPMPHCSSRL